MRAHSLFPIRKIYRIHEGRNEAAAAAASDLNAFGPRKTTWKRGEDGDGRGQPFKEGRHKNKGLLTLLEDTKNVLLTIRKSERQKGKEKSKRESPVLQHGHQMLRICTMILLRIHTKMNFQQRKMHSQ